MSFLDWLGLRREPAPSSRDLDRRAFLRGGFLKMLAVVPTPPPPVQASAVRRLPPLLRPPGAISEAAFLADCTRCGDCVKACPHQAIVLAPERLRHAAGTPIMVPAEHPCRWCVDMPCITACHPQVLRRAADGTVPPIATVRIQALDCLAHQGTTCSSCHERCPVPGAIRLDRGRPEIVTDTCTGCGVCHHVCPAPRNAVLILPLATRHHPGSS